MCFRLLFTFGALVYKKMYITVMTFALRNNVIVVRKKKFSKAHWENACNNKQTITCLNKSVLINGLIFSVCKLLYTLLSSHFQNSNTVQKTSLSALRVNLSSLYY